MLREIKCSKFNKEMIVFDEGLNVILGDDLASNSIGKTTMLMIIDFVFGGESYITCKQDAIENLGHHEFNYKFKFDDEEYYFCRATDNYKFVNICDSKYKKIKEIDIYEYKVFIRDKYKLDYLGNNFRSIVSNYSRIWGKENYNVEKPLKQKDSNMEIAINNLIRLFHRYQSIESIENQLKKVKNKYDAIRKAISNDLIPSINKTQYIKNEKEIDELSKKIEKFKIDMNDVNINLNSLVSEEVFELREEKSQLYSKKNQILNKIKRIESNLNSDELKVNTKMNKLIDFFPNINVDKLNEINNFHKNISKNLKVELREELEKLQAILELINNDINLVEQEIENKTDVKDVPKYNVERLADLLTKKNTLEEINKYYVESQKNKTEFDEVKSHLKEIKDQIISEIANTINIAMYELFNEIYTDKRNSPTFSINNDLYTLKRVNDTGTGSSYTNLITFDLSVFEKTELPFIIHDSILFKNIEPSAFDILTKIYNRFKKQVFISIDEINRFSVKTQNILNDKTVIKLDKDNTLFIKNWKVKKQ